MLKFLFYLFLFYTIFRYVFGGFRINVFHFNQQAPKQPNPTYRDEDEGTITIDPKVGQKKKEKPDKLGEYVDFEEVK
jgi:hypothetical protein